MRICSKTKLHIAAKRGKGTLYFADFLLMRPTIDSPLAIYWTVSLGTWVNKGKRKGRGRLDRPRYQPYEHPPDPVHN